MKLIRTLPVLLLSLFVFPALIAGAQAVPISNPLPGIATFYDFIRQVLSIIVRVGLPVAAVFLVWSGFLFLKSQGNEEELKRAKHAFVWAVVGTAVLLGAWVLAEAICGTVQDIRGDGQIQC